MTNILVEITKVRKNFIFNINIKGTTTHFHRDFVSELIRKININQYFSAMIKTPIKQAHTCVVIQIYGRIHTPIFLSHSYDVHPHLNASLMLYIRVEVWVPHK